jgi:predicted transcriptional regulator
MEHVTKSEEAKMSQKEVTKLIFNIPTSEFNTFKALAESQGISVTSAIRKALNTERYPKQNQL